MKAKQPRRPVVIQTRLAPRGVCINIFGTFWARDTSWVDKYVVNHERIHTAQMRELFFVPFYIIYGLEWLIRLMQYGNRRKAYLNISFEREAYSRGDELDYLQRRTAYAWMRYLRRRH